MFGVERRKIIALQNVTQILKARTALMIPNAIEVVTLDGKRDFFTSFITHDKAYRLLRKRPFQNALARIAPMRLLMRVPLRFNLRFSCGLER